MRILGLDPGSKSIKAVEIEAAFGRFEVRDYFEQEIAADQDQDQAIKKLISQLPRRPDKVCVAIPPSFSTFRNLQLPTKNKKAIQSGVGFELEDELPFPVEECIYDYSVLSQTKQSSQIHVAATLKKHLDPFIAKFRTLEADPDIITTEPWSYRILLNRALNDRIQTSPILLLHIGHSKTVFYLHWKGLPYSVSEIPWGGKDITALISQTLSVPLEEAEHLKVDQGFFPTSTGDNPEGHDAQGALAKILQDSFEIVLEEFRQIELMCRSLTRHSIGTIYLSGGSSLFPGLSGWIEAKAQTPTKMLLSLSLTSTSGVNYSEHTDAKFTGAAALAFCLVGADRSSLISFRKGSYGKSIERTEINLGALRKPGLAVGTVCASLILSLTVQWLIYSQKITDIDKQLEKNIKAFFGQVPPSALKTYLSNSNTLKASLQKELQKQKELNKLFGANPRSPIDLLNNLSNKITRDLVLDLDYFQVGGPVAEPFTADEHQHAVKLTFVASSQEVLDKLATLLNGKLNNLEKGKMEEFMAPTESKVPEKKWKLTFNAKPPGELYAR